MSSESDHDEHEESESRELEHEQHFTREEIADYFETVADGLRSGETISLTIGGDSAEITAPEYLEFEVEYEEEDDQRELEFELEWTEHDEDFEITSG